MLDKTGTCYLTTAIENIRKAGIIDQKEIYGLIIKSAIEGNGIGTYAELISGKMTSTKETHVMRRVQRQERL